MEANLYCCDSLAAVTLYDVSAAAGRATENTAGMVMNGGAPKIFAQNNSRALASDC